MAAAKLKLLYRSLSAVLLWNACCVLEAAPVTAVSGQFTVDSTPPTVPQLLEPAAAEIIIAPFVRLAAISTDNLSGVSAYAFELNSMVMDWQEENWLVFTDISDGTHHWRCRARDHAGNVSGWSGFSSFTFQYGDDTDNDGLPDAWELKYFGSLSFSDGSGDANGDGISDLEKAYQGAHPFEFHLTLQSGWNLLALPCSPSLEELMPLLNNIRGPLWGWRDNRYQQIELPVAHEGFWVYAAEEVANVTVSGLPPEENGVELEPGWNLQGSGMAATVLDPAPLQAVWQWAGYGYEGVPLLNDTILLDALYGYWMFSSGGYIEFIK